MAQYLRDIDIPCTKINQARLKQINDILVSNWVYLNGGVPFEDAIKKSDFKSLTYTIRFDNKGYKLYDFNTLLQHFNSASKIERILFTIEENSNRENGPSIEVWLENGINAKPRLIVTSNDKNWVDATFTNLISILNSYKSDYRWIRSPLTPALIQIVFTALFFFISFITANTLSPKLKSEGAFFLVFFFTFIVFSHVWGSTSAYVFKFFDSLFPQVYFDREDKSTFDKWAQSSINAGMIALILFLLSKLFNYTLTQLSMYLK